MLTQRQYATLDRLDPQTKVIGLRGTVVLVRTIQGAIVAVTASGAMHCLSP